MGGGLASFTGDANLVDNLIRDKVLELFPKLHSYTTEHATSHDFLRARSLCSSIIDINSNGRMMDQTEFLDYFSPLILIYDKFFTTFAATNPSSVLTTKSMVFRLTFLADLVSTLLFVQSAGGGNALPLDTVDHAQELQFVVDFARRYQAQGVRIADYGCIGEALITTMSGAPAYEPVAEKDWWKCYMWRRIYSHFLRLLLEYTTTSDTSVAPAVEEHCITNVNSPLDISL